MDNVLVVAADSQQRSRWEAALSDRGFAVIVAPLLMSALPALSGATIAALIVLPSHPDDLAVLSALSNVCRLPPVLLVGPGAGPALPMKAPAVRRVSATSPPVLLAREVGALIEGCRQDSAPQLPFRICAELDAKWTHRLVAARELDDGFGGGTQPDGFALE